MSQPYISQMNNHHHIKEKETFNQIKHHEDNIKFLNSQSNRLAESVLDLQVSLGRYHSANVITSENGNGGAFHNTEEETMEQILKKENTAAGIFSWIKANAQTSNLAFVKDAVGVVATLGFNLETGSFLSIWVWRQCLQLSAVLMQVLMH